MVFISLSLLSLMAFPLPFHQFSTKFNERHVTEPSPTMIVLTALVLGDLVEKPLLESGDRTKPALSLCTPEVRLDECGSSPINLDVASEPPWSKLPSNNAPASNKILHGACPLISVVKARLLTMRTES